MYRPFKGPSMNRLTMLSVERGFPVEPRRLAEAAEPSPSTSLRRRYMPSVPRPRISLQFARFHSGEKTSFRGGARQSVQTVDRGRRHSLNGRGISHDLLGRHGLATRALDPRVDRRPRAGRRQVQGALQRLSPRNNGCAFSSPLRCGLTIERRCPKKSRSDRRSRAAPRRPRGAGGWMRGRQGKRPDTSKVPALIHIVELGRKFSLRAADYPSPYAA
jgi:hypothetical protein